MSVGLDLSTIHSKGTFTMNIRKPAKRPAQNNVEFSLSGLIVKLLLSGLTRTIFGVQFVASVFVMAVDLFS